MKLREDFLQRLPLSELLRPLNDLPGVLYIVKDCQSRVMAISPESVQRMGYRHEDEIIGLEPNEYLSPELAAKFSADDHWVVTHGQPRLNMVEVWFNSQGKRDWVVTSKYPLRDRTGKTVGILGLLQNIQIRNQYLGHLEPVGKAAAYIRVHLGGDLRVPEIAKHVGLSERQLQRHFRRVFHQSIQQYIIATRIHVASDELAHSSRSIAEIALELGFNDQSAFSNTFRAHTGLSPRAYRLQSMSPH